MGKGAIIIALAALMTTSALYLTQDTDLDGSGGPGPDVHSVLTMDPDVRSTILGLGINSKLIGVNGKGDVINGAPEVDLDGLESAILNYSGARQSSYDGDRTFGSITFGSQGTPGILRIDGDLTLEDGFVGYGVVYVSGTLRMSDNAHIVYSSRALRSLEELLEQIKLEEDGINVRRTSEAPRKLTNKLRAY